MTATLSPSDGVALLALARAAIEDRLLGGGLLVGARARTPHSAALDDLRACFVTLETYGELRGCIGSTEPTHRVREAVVQAALAAAFDDPRFPPLTEEELPALALAVSALTPMVPLAAPDGLVLGHHGVAIHAGERKAIFLPEVAEHHGWSRDELLRQLARKAGLPADAWRDGRLFVFSCERFSESPAGPGRIPRS